MSPSTIDDLDYRQFAQRLITFAVGRYSSAIDFWYGNEPCIVNKYAAKGAARDFFLLSAAINYAAEEERYTFERGVIAQYEDEFPDFDILKVAHWEEDS